MFKKILIANRGEIAVRIIATCREMGIRTVAVYSQADEQAFHVREADEAYFIGPSPATQSYLRSDTILAIAQQCGAEAIHPGYGFLSENATFAESCEQAGIVFIGPSAAAMRRMGFKISARQVAQSVGVPTVPGYDGTNQEDAVLMREATQIGFPLLIKASAGGGGKGMRIVHAADTFLEQLTSARREALAAFGDETVLLERLIQHPRHIEIQVLGDHDGHLLHLGERECSIQRRHQKIVEESPSPALSSSLRAMMGDAAVRIAQAAGYTNAGTIEFILDDAGHFYFLEMNTRLQVEHPVTEQVTGLDLVRQQLLIAAGEPLTLTQKQITQRGHAIEVRIYAEDPWQNFLPSPGLVSHFVVPQGPGIRIDSGVTAGDEITPYYDPMIAKLIVYGADRSSAIARLQATLRDSAILGVATNIALLQTISTHTAFLQGNTHTNFLDEYGLFNPPILAHPPQEVLLAAALYEIQYSAISPASDTPEHYNPWRHLGSWRIHGEIRTITYHYQDHTYQVALNPATHTQNIWHSQIDGQTSGDIMCTIHSGSLVLLRQGTALSRLYVQLQTGEMQVILHGQMYRLQRRQPPTTATTVQSGKLSTVQKALTAPMAGTIVKVRVRNGERVQAHQVLVILSAMKMEHAITAPYEGEILHVHYQEGAAVPGGAVIVEMA